MKTILVCLALVVGGVYVYNTQLTPKQQVTVSKEYKAGKTSVLKGTAKQTDFTIRLHCGVNTAGEYKCN